MSALIGALRVSLSAETAQFERGMQRSQKAAANASTAIAKSLGTLKGLATGLLSGLSVGLFAQGFLAAADASKKLDAQLRLATQASGNFAQAQKDVLRIAQETRAGLEETASLYATFQRNARELGITQEQAARATETVSKAFQVSGASAAEAAGGLRQFLQGVQSGTLRGEELNSVLENAPRLARLLADSLGVTIGELRAMGQEGELTGDKLIRALTDRKFTDGLDKEFKELPVTFDQAMTQVQNAAIITFGAFDRGGEFSKAISNFVVDGSNGFADLARNAEQLGSDIRATMAGLHDVFEPLLAGAMSVFDQIGLGAGSLRKDIVNILGDIDELNNKGGEFFNNNKLGIKLFETNSDLAGKFQRGFNKSRNERKLRSLTGPQAFSQLMLDINGGKPRNASALPRSSGGGDKKKSGRSKADTAERDRLAALRDAYQFDQDMRRAQMDVLRAQQDLTTNYVDRNALSLQMLDLDRKGYEAGLEYQVAAKEITQAQANQLKLEYDRADQLEREKIIKEEQIERAREFAASEIAMLEVERDKLSGEAQLAETASEARAIRLRLLDLEYRIERARLETVLADEQSSEAAKNEARLRLAALGSMQSNDTKGVMQSTQGPMEGYLDSLPNTAAKWQEALEQVRVNGFMALEDSIVGVISGTKSLADAFSDMARQMLADLVRLMVQKAITSAIGNSMGIPGGIPGFATGGSFMIAGNHGRDQNVLALNGLPIAKVSHGERLSISNQDRGMGGGMSVHAPITIQGNATRETAGQIAAAMRRTIADASKKGY